MLYYFYAERHEWQVEFALCWRAAIGTTLRFAVPVLAMATTRVLRSTGTSGAVGRYGVVTPAEPVTLAECQNTQRSGSPTSSFGKCRTADFFLI